MSSKVRLYQLDISADASAPERGKMYSLLDATGAMISCSYSTQRSGPFGLEYSHRIEYMQITTMDELEDAIVHKVITDNPIFANSTLTQIR